MAILFSFCNTQLRLLVKRIRNDRQATRGHIKVEMAITYTDYYCISVYSLSIYLFVLTGSDPPQGLN